eukprot:jgi/Psemu1/61585/gm1.61585_g
MREIEELAVVQSARAAAAANVNGAMNTNTNMNMNSSSNASQASRTSGRSRRSSSGNHHHQQQHNQYTASSSSSSSQVLRRTKITIAAPPGKLGIILANKADGKGTVVSGVRTSSVLVDQISPSDRIVAIDGEDVSRMTVSEITTLMSRKSEYERRLTVLTLPRGNANGGNGNGKPELSLSSRTATTGRLSSPR